MSTRSIIKSIQDIMRKDVGVDGDAQRIAQLGWMIFLKLFDASDQELEFMKPEYVSPIPERLQWRNWAADDEGITGDELITFIEDDLFPSLQELETGDDRRALIVRSVFDDTYNYMKSGTLLRQVINKLDEINFTSQKERHVFNDVYENILQDLQSAGNAAEYYTPRAVTRFMTEMVDPELGETVLDPACGTGGFLSDAIQHLERKGVTNVHELDQLQETIRGIEKKPLPHSLALTNLILHGIEAPAIRRANSLATPLRSYSKSDRVDVILTNPPFGGTEEDGIKVNFPKQYRTSETADLFLALVFRRLKNEDGRAAIVLPDGFLFGESVKTRLKETLLDDFNLHTIVRLPKGVFAPYTDINTNLLFFDADGPTETVWYYEHPLPEGYKQYTKTKPIRFSEFETEMEWWDSREETVQAWEVSRETIIERDYNLDIDNPNDSEDKLEDPDVLLRRYQKLHEEADELRAELKAELGHALARSL